MSQITLHFKKKTAVIRFNSIPLCIHLLIGQSNKKALGIGNDHWSEFNSQIRLE